MSSPMMMPRRLSAGRTRRQIGTPSPWLLLSPLAFVIAAIVGYPFLQTIVLSFTNAKLLAGFGQSHWVGLENYAFALTDGQFRQALLRTLYFTATSVGAEAVLGVLVALLLNQEFRGRSFCRALL